MKKTDLKSLKSRLDSLTIFRDLLNDPVVSALYAYLRKMAVFTYADFVAALYETKEPSLSEHINSICENSENVYVKTIGSGRQVPEVIEKCLSAELEVLQEIADITAKDLKDGVDYQGFLPEFETGSVDIAENYRHRVENIGKYGYGIYAKNKMFYVDEGNSIVPVANPDKICYNDLVDYENERQIIIDNTKALLSGKPAANILLTGDAGTGKSSTVKAIGNEMFADGLRIIEVRKEQLYAIPKILNELADNPLKFIMFIDDLSFLKDDDNFNGLKAVLEGSVSAKSSNVVIYATSNRRHIIKEKFSDREGDDVHRNDTMQELISLSERFGIHVTFGKPTKETFLHIVTHLAGANGIDMPEAELHAGAERFALERGGRSARLAKQFVDGLLSKAEG